MYATILLLHILGATIWTGGHLVLAVTILPPRPARALAWHVVPVTIVSILFVVVGISFRTGWSF
ncbi:MAG TPA: hypothetical protein PLT41_07520 [Thermoanaerobaculia bacterium]|nr:hypothetical protein [Thermoanaerobaculia bacterium]